MHCHGEDDAENIDSSMEQKRRLVHDTGLTGDVIDQLNSAKF